MLISFAVWMAGVGFGVGVTRAVCTVLSREDHNEWCKLIDRQQAIIERYQAFSSQPEPTNERE